jgi:hypothetical protein
VLPVLALISFDEGYSLISGKKRGIKKVRVIIQLLPQKRTVKARPPFDDNRADSLSPKRHEQLLQMQPPALSRYRKKPYPRCIKLSDPARRGIHCVEDPRRSQRIKALIDLGVKGGR